MTIIEAIEDEQLFRPLFKSVDTWRAWLVVCANPRRRQMVSRRVSNMRIISSPVTPLLRVAFSK